MGIRVGSRLLWSALAVLWIGAVVTGLAMLARYDNAPGVAAKSPPQWPAGTRLSRASTTPTLVMLAHPRCDCTVASMAELTELMARASDRPKAYVVFIKPGVVAGGWEQTPLWRSAAAIPGVTVVRDDDGVEASRFGAETSGQVFLYAADGRLLFSGGVTGSRGHAGDNAGRGAILALLRHEPPANAVTPVYGCPLFGPRDARPAGDVNDAAPAR